MLLGLIADQNAPPQGDVHWYDFLHHKTLFFEGGEHLALKFGLPVLYFSMSRIRAGEYRGEVKVVYDGVESVAKHEITERYARLLEQDICREPSRWMWSHRRWKYHPDPVTGEAIYTRK
jgi:KDO2-lipid IV(A) lauroyltransferase